MKRFSQQLHTSAKRVTMTKAESRELKDRLVSYMEYHPLPESMRHTTPVSTPRTSLAGEPFWVLRFNTAYTRAYAGMFALLLLIIVPFAAERAVPGDVLYPVKVRFNEEVRSSLAVSPYQQVEWETKRVERRLAEARLLANEGKLTPELENEVAVAVKTHSDAAQAGIARLRETDRDEAAIAELSFASALEVESEVLETEAERQQAAGASTTATIAAAVADVRASVASPETTDVSYERLLARVEDETTHATEILYSLREEVTDQEREDIDRRLADISRKVEQAAAAYATTSDAGVASATIASTTASSSSAEAAPAIVRDERKAKQYLREALRDTQKLIRFMTDIDVKANVSVDALVPVTPTDDERATAITAYRNRLANELATIDRSTVTDEKAQFGLARVDELDEAAEQAFVSKNYDAAEVAIREALELVADIQNIVDVADIPVDVPSPATSTEPVLPATSTTTTATTSEGSDSETTE